MCTQQNSTAQQSTVGWLLQRCCCCCCSIYFRYALRLWFHVCASPARRNGESRVRCCAGQHVMPPSRIHLPKGGTLRAIYHQPTPDSCVPCFTVRDVVFPRYPFCSAQEEHAASFSCPGSSSLSLFFDSLISISPSLWSL